MQDNSALPSVSPGRRAASYWFADGLPDILAGTTLLVFGLPGLWWGIHLSKSATQPDFFLIAGGVLLLYWKEREILDFLKSRLTYPRTGYVQPPQDLSESGLPNTLTVLAWKPWPQPDENVTHFKTRTVMVVFWWCSIFLIRDAPWNRWYTPLAMPVLAAALYVWNRRSEHPYRWWSALILALTGPALMWVDVPTRLQPLLMPLLAGGWLVAEGACTLFRYLRANPYPHAAESVQA
jgi:hypothetical protein